MNWYHTLRGQYSIETKGIALDWGKLFLHPEQAMSTAIHELMHGIIAHFDFGQASENFFATSARMMHLTEKEKEEIKGLLFRSQEYVQEGGATLMQVLNLSESMGKRAALEWADRNLPKDYQTKLNSLRFVFDLSRRYRELFTDLSVRLAMESGFRLDAGRHDVFGSPAKLKTFLSDPNRVPDERLKKVVELVRFKPWMLTKPLGEIAHEAGITFYGPPTKAQVAEFLNYAGPLAKITKVFTEADIGETPSEIDGYTHLLEDMTIGNLNMNFRDTSTMLPDEDALLHYSDVIQAILIVKAGEEVRELVTKLKREPPDVVFGIFRPTGEKYTAALTSERASTLLAGPLNNPTLLIKAGGFDITQNRMVPSPDMRHADVIIYNNIKQLSGEIDKAIATYPDIRFKGLHLGASPNHPFRTIFFQFGDQHPIHLVNTMSGGEISTLFERIADRTNPFSEEEIAQKERTINNVMAVWMSMPWEINWVKTMLKKDAMYHRPAGT